MRANFAKNEESRSKAQAEAAGDGRMQLSDFNRPRRRFVLGAWLSALGRRLQSGQDVMASAMTRQRHANQSPF